jgi:secretory phospholipase A2
MKLPIRTSLCRITAPVRSESSQRLVYSRATGIVPQGTCGTSWNEPWVRDSYGNADFTSACRNHDDCYDACGASKDGCDSRFHSELQSVCDNAYRSRWHAVQHRGCKELANTYYSSVRRMGGDAYRDAQGKCP